MAKKPAEIEAPKPISAATRVVVLHGKEYFLRTLYTQELRDQLAKAHGEVDQINYDGQSCAAADVLDECRSFGLIAAHKMVVVDNAADLVKEEVRGLFENYCKAPSEGATLVLRSDIWRAGNLDKLIHAVGTIKVCEPLADARAIVWAITRASKRHRATLEQSAAEALVSRVGTDLARLDTELAKLGAAAGTDGKITPELVREFVGLSREEEVWGIQQTLLSGQAEESLAHLRYVLDVSRKAPTLVTWAITDLARKLHGFSRGLKAGQDPDTIARSLKVWGPSKGTLAATGSRLQPARALRLFETCVEADSRQKSGLGEGDLTLERLVIQFAATISGR